MAVGEFHYRQPPCSVWHWGTSARRGDAPVQSGVQFSVHSDVSVFGSGCWNGVGLLLVDGQHIGDGVGVALTSGVDGGRHGGGGRVAGH